MTRTRIRAAIALGAVTAVGASALTLGAGATPAPEAPPAQPGRASSPLAVGDQAPIANPGFEDPADDDGTIPGWNQVGAMSPAQSYGIADDVAHTGEQSLRLDDNDDVRALSVETDPFPVEGGVAYEATAMMAVDRGTLGLFVRFYDAAGNRLTNVRVAQGSTAGEWEEATLSVASPEAAVTGTVLINSASVDVGRGHVDDVAMVVTDTDPLPPEVQEILNGDDRISYLGAPVRSQIPGVPSVGIEDGRAVGYQMFKGIGSTEQPGTFVVFDLETGETVRTFPVDGVDNNWGSAVAADGRVYFATYPDYGLHRYDPATATVENLGPINPPAPNEGYPWTMTRGPGNSVFIGTYPKGDLWQFLPESGTFENWGHEAWGPSDPAQSQYLRGLAYDAENDQVFLSTGSVDPAVWRLDVQTREAVRITDDTKQPGLSTESFISALTVVGGHVFARGYTSKKLLVMDRDGNTEFWGPAGGASSVQGREFTPHPTDPDKVLFTNPQELWTYSLREQTTAPTGATLGNYLSAAIADPADPTRLLGLSGGGTFAVDLENPAGVEVKPFSFAQPSVLETVLPGPDNTMWAAGYMSSLAQVDTSGNGVTYPTLQVSRQYESSIVRDGLMYLGAYTGSSFQVYDTSTPMEVPETLFTGTAQGFDRPVTMTYDSQNDKAYMGSIPGYGLNQGGISVWDFGTESVEHYSTEVVVEQGIASAVFNPGDGMVYLGTNVDGGNGHPDSGQTEAYLVTWDPTSDTKVREIVPVPDRRGITGLTVGPDGNIWGVAEDIVFIFDPAAGEVVHQIKVLGSGYGSGNHWAWGYMAYSDKDEAMYASLGSRLFRIDPETREVSDVGIGRGSRMHLDDEGNVYFLAYYGTHHLFRFTPDGAAPTCDKTVTGPIDGTLSVAPDSVVCVNDATINGGVDVAAGGTLIASDSRINGELTAAGAASVQLRDITASGGVQVDGSTGDVVLAGNDIRGTLSCADNATAPTHEGRPNTVTGQKVGQCADL